MDTGACGHMWYVAVWLFPCLPGFGENVRPLLPRLHLQLLLFLFKVEIARAH